MPVGTSGLVCVFRRQLSVLVVFRVVPLGVALGECESVHGGGGGGGVENGISQHLITIAAYCPRDYHSPASALRGGMGVAWMESSCQVPGEHHSLYCGCPFGIVRQPETATATAKARVKRLCGAVCCVLA